METTLPNGDVHLELDNSKPMSITDIKTKMNNDGFLKAKNNKCNHGTENEVVHICDPSNDLELDKLKIYSEEEKENDLISEDLENNQSDEGESTKSHSDSYDTTSSTPKDTESSECENKECQETQIVSAAPTVSPIHYVVYQSEEQMPDIMQLITKDLSEPYSVYTYRYFIHNWPKLCFLAIDNEVQNASGEKKCVGAIVCKLDLHKSVVRRGYIAMLAVDHGYRRRKIGSHLVMKAIRAMVADNCDEVVLETEITNKPALRLYENLGFVRDKRLFRYYLNGVDALRLKLWLR